MKHLSKLTLKKENFISDNEMKHIVGGTEAYIEKYACGSLKDEKCNGTCAPRFENVGGEIKTHQRTCKKYDMGYSTYCSCTDS